MVLTVDEIRREMEKSGELARRHSLMRDKKEGNDMPEEKVARAIPDTVDQGWIYRSRKSEIKKVLADRYGLGENLLGGSLDDLRKIASEKIGFKRKRPGAPTRAKVTGAKTENPIKTDGNGNPRLVVAEILPCPCCGANLMIQR